MSREARQLEHFVREFIISESLIPKDGHVLAAVSGGQDSMAMLEVLHRLSTDMHFTLSVAHFDHKLRDDSQLDLALVKRYADECALAFFSGEEDVARLTQQTGDTIEEAGRKARYRFLFDTCDRIGADRLAVGHTSDDQVETVLMRILRGTGIRGLAGMQAKRGKLIRPLLRVGRRDVEAFCRSEGLPFTSDPSNQDVRFMRNRIRSELLPLLKNRYHPGVDINLLSLANNAQILIASIRSRTNPIIERDLKHPAQNEWILSMKELNIMDDTSLFVLLGDVLSDHLSTDMDFTQVHYRELIRLCRTPERSGKSLALPGIIVKREFDELIFNKTAVTKEPHAEDTLELSSVTLLSVGIKVPGTTRAAGVTVQSEVFDALTFIAKSHHSEHRTVACFSMDQINPPLVLRNPLPGDRMKPFGMQGTKKLSDIFIDKKVPARERAKTLVISDENEILWLVGLVTSESYRITENTKNVLKITVRRE